MSVVPIPERYHTVTPYLLVDGVADLVVFLVQAFGGREVCRLDRDDGSVMHVEVELGDSIVMMGEPTSQFEAMPAALYLYVEDCDAVYQQAVRAGAFSLMEPTTMYHAGERYGGVRDPSGNIWWIATHVEDVSAEEQKRRAKQLKV
jgi:uncharacterized glyoxalase superfamily protein PhnB